MVPNFLPQFLCYTSVCHVLKFGKRKCCKRLRYHACFYLNTRKNFLKLSTKIRQVLAIVFYVYSSGFQIFLCEISSNISTSYIQRVQDQMEICFWSIHNLPKKTYSQFFQKIVLIRIVVICFYINMFTSAILAWVYDWHPQWFSNVGYVERVSLMLFYTAAFIGAYIMCYMHVYIAVYFALNMNIQLMILASYFENITDAINESLVRHRISEYVRNQEIISNRLLIGIKQHIAYKR